MEPTRKPLFPIVIAWEDEEEEEYTDNDDMKVHAPREDQMDTYANKE